MKKEAQVKHKHHIIPKHMGGTNDPSNIVELTIEEHAEAHRKLFEEHGHWQDEFAWKGLSGQLGNKEKITKEFYRQNQKIVRATWKVDDEYREKMRMAKLGVPLKEEHKKKISKGLMGRKQPQRQKDAVADAMAMKWIVETPEGKKHTTYNLNEFARKHNLGTAWQGNAIKHGHSKGYEVKRLSETKSTPTSGYRKRGKNI